jgi:hypothetical protein
MRSYLGRDAEQRIIEMASLSIIATPVVSEQQKGKIMRPSAGKFSEDA